MKTFYTERDIDDMRAAGAVEIEIDDDVVLTDLARERAIALGLRMKRVEKRSGKPPGGLPRLAVAPQIQLPPAVITVPKPAPAPLPPPPVSPPSDEELAAQIKAAVLARLGNTPHTDLLDKIIPMVLTRLRK
jgi:hypothetical protein